MRGGSIPNSPPTEKQSMWKSAVCRPCGFSECHAVILPAWGRTADVDQNSQLHGLRQLYRIKCNQRINRKSSKPCKYMLYWLI